MARVFFSWGICVIILAVSGIGWAGDDLEKKIRDEQKKLEQIKKEISEKKKASRKTAREEQNVQKELKRLKDQLGAQEKKLGNLNRRLKKVQGDIGQVRTEISVLERKMEARREEIGRTLRRMAMAAPSEFGFLPAPDPGIMEGMAEVRYLRVAATAGHGTWRAMESTKEGTEGRLADLRGTYQGLSRDQTKTLRRKEEISRTDEKKRVLLADIRKERSVVEAAIRDLEAASARVRDLISSYEKSIGATRDAGFAREKGKLPWPLEGRVVGAYGPQKHPEFGTVVERKGVDIAAASGAEIHAVFAGTVVFSDWLKGYGRMVIVDHGGKYYTVYGHAGHVLVSRGNVVKKGEVIARVGETGSGEDGLNVLYFEVRHGGGTENPLAWLKSKH
ncbi:MAG: peptidoglycan DD-metalloendopeptidase family protein [Nitrospirae bacterium]|nr:peptidoglycan DD-metalloendopeptidase family protein [Nitrospirota bacterium]